MKEKKKMLKIFIPKCSLVMTFIVTSRKCAQGPPPRPPELIHERVNVLCMCMASCRKGPTRCAFTRDLPRLGGYFECSITVDSPVRM